MSLQVWLPLNGDLHNQGLSSQTKNITTTPIWATVGKLGDKSLYTKTSMTTMNFPGLVGVSTYSVAYWLYIPTAIAPTAWSDMFGIGFNCAGTTYYERDERRAATTTGRHNYHLAKSTNEGSNTNAYYGTIEDDDANDKWVHYVLVKDDVSARLYKNSQLVLTVPRANFETTKRTMTGAVYLGANGCEAYLQDFRIYDHALSVKEIEEISKGLILHYKLDNNGFGNENYWGNGKPLKDNSFPGELRTMFARTNSAYASVPTFIPNQYIETKFLSTRTPVEDGGIQFQKLQRYSETVNSMCPILEHLKTGEHFTISYELYITSPMKVKFHLSKKLDGTSTKVQSNPDSIQISTLNTWTKISQSIEIPSSFDESNLTTESRLGMYISIDEILGTTSSGEVTIRIRNIKFEKGQVATDWTPARADFGHSSDNIIFDSSGYNNNGSIIGDLTTIMQGPRYNYAAHLESSSPTTNNNTGLSYIQTPLQISAPTQMTVCWWANPENGYNNSVGHAAWCTSSNSQSPVDYNSTAFHHRDSRFDICLNSAATTSLGLAFNNYTKNEWHYYCVVYDGKNAILYKDGVETNRSSISSTTAPLKSFTNLYIGFSKAGGVWRKTLGAYSDFRIYATALTAEQVKELYNTSTTIDKNGNIYARELVEE